MPLASQAASLSTKLSHPAVVIRGGENKGFRGKPPALDRRPLPCHILTPGIDPGLQQWQASDLTTALSRPLIYIHSHAAAPVAEWVRSLYSFDHLTAVSGVGSSPALATCETSQVLLVGVSGGFPGGLPFRPTYRLARLYE